MHRQDNLFGDNQVHITPYGL